MNNKRLISLTICWILGVVSGLCVVSSADIESGAKKEAEGHFEKANEFFKSENYEAAISEYNKVITVSPDSEIAQDAQYWIGQSYFQMGQFDAALSAFQKLLDEYPTSKTIPTTKPAIERVQQAKKNRALFEAVKSGDIEKIKLNIRAGADINARDMWGGVWSSALHYAIIEGHTAVVEVLVSEGADIEIRDSVKRNPLFLAFQLRHSDMVKLLIAKGSDVNAKGGSRDLAPLHQAVLYGNGNKELVDLLISADADVNIKNSWDETPIFIAMVKPNREIVELLLKKGPEVPPLQLAAYRGNLQEVTRLLQDGIDVDSRNDFAGTALHVAVAGGQQQVVAFLVDSGADLNAKSGWGQVTPLHLAAQKGLRDITELLINRGADINAKGSQDITPLHMAANKEVADLLISKGADINLKMTYGATPLNTAAGAGHTDVAELLIANGFDVDVKSGSWTPLHRAVYNGHKEMAEFLIAKGADINAKGPKGNTPLTLARDQDIMKLLIDRGADLNISNNAGLTPLDLAQQERYTDIVELLRKHGAKE